MDMDAVAKACIDTAMSISGYHPYLVAHELARSVAKYPESEDIAYRIKMHIFNTTDPITVAWALPVPEKQTTFDNT